MNRNKVNKILSTGFLFLSLILFQVTEALIPLGGGELNILCAPETISAGDDVIVNVEYKSFIEGRKLNIYSGIFIEGDHGFTLIDIAEKVSMSTTAGTVSIEFTVNDDFITEDYDGSVVLMAFLTPKDEPFENMLARDIKYLNVRKIENIEEITAKDDVMNEKQDYDVMNEKQDCELFEKKSFELSKKELNEKNSIVFKAEKMGPVKVFRGGIITLGLEYRLVDLKQASIFVTLFHAADNTPTDTGASILAVEGYHSAEITFLVPPDVPDDIYLIAYLIPMSKGWQDNVAQARYYQVHTDDADIVTTEAEDHLNQISKSGLRRLKSKFVK